MMLPNFFEEGLRVNAEAYIHVLHTHVLPWIRRVARGEPWIWQQDGARCHTAQATTDFLDAEHVQYVPPDTWLPNSPDLNPLDYFVWGAVERLSNATPHPTKDSLEADVVSSFNSLKMATAQRACERFRGRIIAVM